MISVISLGMEVVVESDRTVELKQLGYAVVTAKGKVAWTGSNRSGYRKVYLTKGGAGSACADAMRNGHRHRGEKLRVVEVYFNDGV